jgi:hypothetical protein
MSRFNSAASSVQELAIRLVSFFNKGVGTDNLTNDSVTRDIVNSNVAGSGLSQDADGSLKISNAYITEAGSNANGYYRKWSDGTLECWGTKDLESININSDYGGKGIIYVSATYVVTWPVTFTSVNHSAITVCDGSQSYGYFTSLVPPTTTTQAFSLVRFSALTNQAIKVGFYAIGRWKA